MATDAADLLKGHGPDRYGNSREVLDRLFPMVHVAYFVHMDQREAEREDPGRFSAIARQALPDSYLGINAARYDGIRISSGESLNISIRIEADLLILGAVSRALMAFGGYLSAEAEIGIIRLTYGRPHGVGDQAFSGNCAARIADRQGLTVPPCPLLLNLRTAFSG